MLIGFGFDGLAALTGKKFAASSIRVKKFMATTAFNSSISETAFTPSLTLEQGIERTIRNDFLEDNSHKIKDCV